MIVNSAAGPVTSPGASASGHQTGNPDDHGSPGTVGRDGGASTSGAVPTLAISERCHAALASAAPASPPGFGGEYVTDCAPVATCDTAGDAGSIAAYASHISAAHRCGSSSHVASAMA